MRDRDAEKKQKGADYVDKKHHAADKPDVQEGGLVLLEKWNETKLSKNYEKEPYQVVERHGCLLYTSPSPRDGLLSRMPSSA